MLQKFALYCILPSLAACTNGYGITRLDAPPAEVLTPHPGWAEVCVARPSWIGYALTVAVKDNGELVGATRAYTHFCWLAAPGYHRVAAIIPMAPDVEIDLWAEPDQFYSYALSLGFGDHLTPLDPTKSDRAIRGTRYALVSQVPEGPLPPPLPAVLAAMPPQRR